MSAECFVHEGAFRESFFLSFSQNFKFLRIATFLFIPCFCKSFHMICCYAATASRKMSPLAVKSDFSHYYCKL